MSISSWLFDQILKNQTNILVRIQEVQKNQTIILGDLTTIIKQGKIIMSDVDDLNTSLVTLTTNVAAIGDDVTAASTELSDLAKALATATATATATAIAGAGAPNPAIQAVVAGMNTQAAALATAGTALNAAVTAAKNPTA